MPEVKLSVFDPKITDDSPAGSCLLKMLRAALRTHELDVFTAQTDLQSARGVQIHHMPVPVKPVFLESVLFTVMSIFCDSLVRGNRLKLSTQGGFPFCDISYAHCCHKLFLTRYRKDIAGGFFTRAARLLNHTWSAAMEAIAFHRAHLIIVPSAGLAAELRDAYGERVASKLRRIPNPVDCSKFARPAERDPDRPFTFSFCALGNFEWKGLPLILEALATGIVAELVVIGGSKTDIERYRGLSGVRFVGRQADVRPYLWTSHAFVFPSVYETFPLVCLQAAAAGLPLIATDLNGLEELLEPGVSGWRVERTVSSIAEAMREARAHPEVTAAMGRNAQAKAQKYDEPLFQQRWLKLLAEF